MIGHTLRPGILAATILVTFVITSDRKCYSAAPVPPAQARGEFADDGSYKIVLSCDAAAFVMQAASAPPDEAVSELWNKSDEELGHLIEQGRKAFSEQLKIQFDGEPAPQPVVRFPTLKELRQASPQEIHIEGKCPPRAIQCQIAFPLGVGPVDLTLQGTKAERLRQRLEKGETSAPFFWAGEPPAAPPEPAP